MALALRYLSPPGLPFMARRNFRYELRASATFPLAMGLAEGFFASVVAAKFFGAPAYLIALIGAAPMFGNVVALFWSQLAERRPKVRFINLLQGATVATLALVPLTALLPKAWGAWAFALAIILVRVLASGIVTLRGVVWRLNYPRAVRGRLVARLTIVATATLAVATTAGSAALDWRPGSFVVVYLVGAALGVVGMWEFGHLRVRRERSYLRRMAQPIAEGEAEAFADDASGNPPPSVAPPVPARIGLLSTLRLGRDLLARDDRFRAYQRWQFVQGSAFMGVTPILAIAVGREMTDPDGQFALSTVLLQAMPGLVAIVGTQLWAPWFDRLPIFRFRALHSRLGLLTMATLAAGMLLNSLWVVAGAMVFWGLSMGGGALAWNLGHNAFAKAEEAGLYMGVHVMLTGLRGLLAPFVATFLYATCGLGRWTFLIGVALLMASTWGYGRLAREEAS